MIHLCDYGCGQEAKYQFKNGKWCCSKSHQSCPNIRKKLCGRHLSKGHKRKISLSITGENNPRGMLGRHLSKGHKRKISLSLLGKHLSKEHKKKLSISIIGKNLGKHLSKEHKKKIGDGQRTSFKEIRKFVESQGYELLSKESDYKNQFSYLWFRCPKGHILKKRWDGFLAGYRCRECYTEIQRQKMLNGQAAYMLSFNRNPSKPQVKLFNLIKERYPSAIINYQVLNFSIDIAIPNLRIAIEYDESYWHQDQEKDNKRQKEIEDQGWTFLRYRDYVPSKEELERDINNIKETNLSTQETNLSIF